MARPDQPSHQALELAQITSLGLGALREAWTQRWGEPPAYRSRDLLLRAMAYRVQTQAHGTLSFGLRRELRTLAGRFNDDRKFDPGPAVSLQPGTTLIREWAGRRHEVAVTTQGFAYDGKPFTFLSQVAFAITGTRWNGLVFFGIRARKPNLKRKGAAE